MVKTIGNLSELKTFLAGIPEGTTGDVLASDLEAGNFESASFMKPDGTVVDIRYIGPVEKGYVSPFEKESQ